VANLAYFTPSTVWLLRSKSFKTQKLQQMVRMMASFTIHDRFKDSLDHMINFSTLIKSPSDLPETWLKAVVRTKTPLSYKQVTERYWDALQQITGTAELAQVKGQHLSQWPSILFGNNPIDLGKPAEECWTKLIEENPELSNLLSQEYNQPYDSFFH